MTFTRDVSDPAELDGHLVRLATEVTESVVAEGRTVTHVAVKVRTASFFTRTKISKLPAPTTDPAEVAARGAARPRTVRADAGGPPARRPRRAGDALLTYRRGAQAERGGGLLRR